MKIKDIKYLFFLLIINLLMAQCKKKDMPDIPQDSSPIFNVDGTLGGKSISLHAGQQNAFMHTDIEQFNNLHQYSGELNDGKTVFKIQLFPGNVDIPSLYNNFILKDGYDLSKSFGSTPLLTISPEDFPHSDLINEISWTVDNETQLESTLKIYDPGKYMVCATLYFNDGKIESTCNTVIVGYKLHANYKLDYSITSDSELEANINAPDNVVSKVSWYIDDVFQSNQIDFHPTDSPEKFSLKAEVEFENGVVGTRKVYINKSSPSSSIPDFTSLGQKSSLTWDNTVLVTIVKDNQTYTSLNNTTSPSQFNVNKISDYKVNLNGFEVKLINGTLTTPFVNSISGETLSGDFKIDIGVAY